MSLNSYDITKQNVVYSVFNQYLFNEVKTNIDLIERYFLMDVTTMNNSLIKSLLDAVRKYEFTSIDEPLFRSIFASLGKTDNESADILEKIMNYKLCDNEQIDPLRKYIRGIGNQSLIDLASSRYKSDPIEYNNFIRTHEYKVDYSDVFSVVNFDNVDINSITAQSLGGWKSAYDFINKSYQPNQKYENGQMVLVVAPPGCGKTLFMMNEAYYMCLQGARCHYLTLGDMNQKDFVQRIGAISSGMTFGDTMVNIKEIYSSLRTNLGGRFNLTILPAAQVTVDEYIDYMMERLNEFDVLFVDYDSNFRQTQIDNMYKEGGYIYDNLTKLTKAGKLVFIASQPKIGAWRNEVLELTDAGESSRKQHNVDVMITISRGLPGYNPNHIGRMKIAKNRRGEEGTEVPYIRLNNGRFRILTETVYSIIKGISEKRNYTDDDINKLLATDNSNRLRANGSAPITQAQMSINTGPQPINNSSTNSTSTIDLQKFMATELNKQPML